MHLKPSGADKPSPTKAHMAGCVHVYTLTLTFVTVGVHVETAAAVKLITKELKWKQKSGDVRGRLAYIADVIRFIFHAFRL